MDTGIMSAPLSETKSANGDNQHLCRFCRTPLRQTLVDLGMSPLCESYVTTSGLDKMEPFYPLHVRVCDKCFLVQVGDYVSSDHIFTEYAYFSSFSDTWLKHAADYVDMIVSRFNLGRASLAVELASNDGYLLRNFVAKGIPALGVEPAANVAKVAVANGVPTLVKFFGCETARAMVAAGQVADLVAGNNVLAQVPDLNDFVGGIRILLKPQGVATLEFPHLMRMMAENQYDTIYHEHFSYFSFIAAEKIFAAHDLVLFDVEELPTHGGSIRIYARHQEDASKPVGQRVLELRDRELSAGFDRMETYSTFGEKVKESKRRLLEFFIQAKRSGKTGCRLRCARQRQYPPELLRDQNGLSRFYGGSQSIQTRQIPAGHAYTDSDPGQTGRSQAGLRAHFALEF